MFSKTALLVFPMLGGLRGEVRRGVLRRGASSRGLDVSGQVQNAVQKNYKKCQLRR
jgi:hypothetical protein